LETLFGSALKKCIMSRGIQRGLN